MCVIYSRFSLFYRPLAWPTGASASRIQILQHAAPPHLINDPRDCGVEKCCENMMRPSRCRPTISRKISDGLNRRSNGSTAVATKGVKCPAFLQLDKRHASCGNYSYEKCLSLRKDGRYKLKIVDRRWQIKDRRWKMKNKRL